MKNNKEQEILKILFKDFLTPYNSRSISKVIGISHPGAFKILKRLEKREIVKAQVIGKANIYSPNLDNTITQKEIELSLTIEAQQYKRWLEEFRELEEKTDFVILFGSVLINEKQARDIDILVVADKDKFNEVKKVIHDRNKLSLNKIHLLLQSPEDFKKDVSQRNRVIIEIIKKGIVLFGQDKFRKSIIL